MDDGRLNNGHDLGSHVGEVLCDLVAHIRSIRGLGWCEGALNSEEDLYRRLAALADMEHLIELAPAVTDVMPVGDSTELMDVAVMVSGVHTACGRAVRLLRQGLPHRRAATSPRVVAPFAALVRNVYVSSPAQRRGRLGANNDVRDSAVRIGC